VLASVVIPGKPDGGEVTPAQLADYGVFAILELLANLNRVVATLAIVFGIFLVGGVIGGVIDGGGRGRVSDICG
jgi:hypothetical protein